MLSAVELPFDIEGVWGAGARRGTLTCLRWRAAERRPQVSRGSGPATARRGCVSALGSEEGGAGGGSWRTAADLDSLEVTRGGKRYLKRVAVQRGLSPATNFSSISCLPFGLREKTHRTTFTDLGVLYRMASSPSRYLPFPGRKLAISENTVFWLLKENEEGYLLLLCTVECTRFCSIFPSLCVGPVNPILLIFAFYSLSFHLRKKSHTTQSTEMSLLYWMASSLWHYLFWLWR